MMPLPNAAIAVCVAVNSMLSPPVLQHVDTFAILPLARRSVAAAPLSDSVALAAQIDTVVLPAPVPVAMSIVGTGEPIGMPKPVGLTRTWVMDMVVPADTVRKPRQKAFVYSDGYETRLTIHRRMSWAMLPLFALSYFSGQQILDKADKAPQWARNLHRPAATGSAVLFTVNTVTGYWNLWEGRHDPNNRTRKLIHSALFTAASAGFVYAGTKLANDAEQSQAKRLEHRNVALASIGVSTASWLIMLIGN